jgi:hypothetical protein
LKLNTIDGDCKAGIEAIRLRSKCSESRVKDFQTGSDVTYQFASVGVCHTHTHAHTHTHTQRERERERVQEHKSLNSASLQGPACMGHSSVHARKFLNALLSKEYRNLIYFKTPKSLYISLYWIAQ